LGQSNTGDEHFKNEIRTRSFARQIKVVAFYFLSFIAHEFLPGPFSRPGSSPLLSELRVQSRQASPIQPGGFV
jgi:hypothetical protein